MGTALESVVYAHPGVDVSFAQIDRLSLEPALAYTHPDYPQVVALDASLRDALDELLDRVIHLGLSVFHADRSLLLMADPDGDLKVLELVLQGMNKKVDANAEDRKGGAGHVDAEVLFQPMSLTSGSHMGPGTWAVVTTTSMELMCLESSACWAAFSSSVSSRAYPPSPVASATDSSLRNWAPSDSACSLVSLRTS